jgi:branched-chain amino acid transport system ATP-binding protein
MNPSASLTAGSPLFTARSIGAAYGRIQVVFDVDLEVRSGELLGLLGPNGAGKSSLLGALAGSVRGGGELVLGTQSLQSLAAHQRAAHGLAFVPERRRNVFSGMTVQENLALGLRLCQLHRRAQVRDRILQLFPILQERMGATAGMLSGGEQQMLAIGMALGKEPSVLILDEPSQGLAPVVLDILQRTFETLKQEGLALLVAEQNLAFAAKISDRYVVLSHGAIVASGGKEGLQQRGALLAAYMDVE